MPHPQARPAKAAVDNQNSPLAPLAAAIGFALTTCAMPLVAGAEEAAKPVQSEPRQLPKLVASDADEATPKVDTVYSPKFTEPLINIPQTVTVVPQLVLQQQGARTLTEALRNTPGITMQLGENGNTSAGDSFSIRGTSAQSNIFVDGIRDLGAVTRDTFNVDQVEIFKGAVGADNGRGAVAGYVNMVSKQAQLDEFRFATVSATTAHNYRATADMNTQLSATSAMRANVMWQKGGVPGCDVVEDNRYGFAPSFALGLGSATRVYLYSQHVRADNVPDGGIPAIGYPGFYNAALANVPVARVDSNNFYGRYDDYEKIQADMATVRVEHDVSSDLKLINSTRYGRSDMDRVMTGVNALTVSAVTDPSTWTVARIRQVTDQRNDIVANQTNLHINLNTGAVRHEIATGLELMREGQTSLGWTGYGALPAYLNGGTALNLAPANLYHPDPYFAYTYFTPARTGGDSDGTTKTVAGYVFDTLKFGERWLVNAGVRYERYDTDFYGVSFNNTTGVATITDETKRGWLLSWKTGVVFKPTTRGSLYVSASNTRTPPGSDNFTLASAQSVTNSNANIASLKPQEAMNVEAGVKWDVLAERLSLNAAVYQTDNKNQLTGKDPSTGDVVQYGKRRVRGVELGAVGKITDAWQVLAGAAWSDNEQVEGDVFTSATATTQNLTGSTARWAPKYSANLWTTYTLQQWNAGLGMTYISQQLRATNPDANVAPAAGVSAISGYTVFDGMLGYTFNSNVGVQLNVFNLLNKDYISTLNNGGSRLRIGAPRYAQLTATVKF